MMISELYSRLEDNPAVREEIFGEIKSQYELALERILDVTRQKHLLEKNVLLRYSIEVRNPYIDPMNYIQVRLLKEKRSDEKMSAESEETILTGVKLSIVGIASGMKNTG
jgi:phosphoenolpyruvate carboxylase